MRLTIGAVDRVYAAAETWVERALLRNDSLFTPGKPIWSTRWLREVRLKFLDSPEESDEGFLPQLESQLAGSPPEVYQLVAEAFYFHYLIIATKNSAGERQKINTVLGWSRSPAEIPQELADALTPGILWIGAALATAQPYCIGFLIEFAEQFRSLKLAERRRILADPWKSKDYVMGLNFQGTLLKESPNSTTVQREAFLHLVFPDVFHPIVSARHKQCIADTFARFLVTRKTSDVDDQLNQIYAGLEPIYGKHDHFFYQSGIYELWHPNNLDQTLWEEFLMKMRANHA